MMIDCQASAWHQKSHIYFFFAQVDMCGKLVSLDKEKWVIIRQSGNVLPIFSTPQFGILISCEVKTLAK